MFSGRVKDLSILLGIVLYSMFACCSLVETVICYGADGHVKIETASDHCSGHLPDCQVQQSLAFFANLPFSENDGCGSCSDIPLSTGKSNLSLALKSFRSLQIQPVVVGAFEYLESNSPSSIIGTSFSNQSNPALNIIQTTILLI